LTMPTITTYRKVGAFYIACNRLSNQFGGLMTRERTANVFA